ncbi:hypothetical protein TNCV_472951 [Trichonephila clavipes]|nr:hypothetical protein TNCV_472951 [Trichonephila clavipes]
MDVLYVYVEWLRSSCFHQGNFISYLLNCGGPHSLTATVYLPVLKSNLGFENLILPESPKVLHYAIGLRDSFLPEEMVRRDITIPIVTLLNINLLKERTHFNKTLILLRRRM